MRKGTHCNFILLTVSDTFSLASSFQINSGFSWEPEIKLYTIFEKINDEIEIASAVAKSN